MIRLWPVAVAAALAGCWSPDDTRLLDHVNTARAAVGVAPVGRDDGLHAMACRYAADLAAIGQLRHDRARALADMDAWGPWGWSGENLAVQADTDAVVTALAGSPTHLATMIDPRFTVAGICVFHATGAVWVVERFAGPRG